MNPELLRSLYDQYVGAKLISSQTTFEQFSSASSEQLDELYQQGVGAKIVSSKTPMADFKGAWGYDDATKKKDEQVSIGVQEDMVSVTPSKEEQDFLSEQLSEEKRVDPANPFQQTLLSDSPTDAFEQSFETITPELIGREEEFTVPKLNYQFNDYGFTFEETGIGDAMRVQAKNGKEIRIDLDPFTGRGERAEAEKLRNFMKENKVESERLARQSYLVDEKIRKVNTEEELKNTVSVFNEQTEELKNDMQFFLQAKSESDKIYNENFKGFTSKDIAADPILKKAYDEWYNGRQAMQLAYDELKTRENNIRAKGYELDRIAAEYTQMKSKQGSWVGGLLDALMSGFGAEAASVTGIATDLAVELGIGENVEKKQERIIDEAIEYLDAEGTGIDTAKLREDMSEMTMEELEKYLNTIDTKEVKPRTETRMTSLGEERPEEKITLYEYADAKVKDLTKKAIKNFDSNYEAAKAGRKVNVYSSAATEELAPKGMMDLVRTSIVDKLGAKDTTEQWADLQKQGFWGGAILGVTESLPAMMGGAGKIGATQRLVQMTAQATDAIDKEMAANPEFDDVTEKEKYYVKAPIGVAVGVLENIGFRNVINQKGLVNSVVGKALGKSTSKTTAKEFSDFIREDVNSMIGRGLLTLTAAGMAEFETGAAQELATLTVKEIYNQSKDKEMFQTPDTWIDWAKDIAYAGAQEAVGGFILGVPSAISNAAATGKLESISNEEFEVFEMMANDPEYKTMLVTRQKQKILDGQMTHQEAKAEDEMVDELQGLLQEIPDNLTTETKKEALQLILERNTLRKKIANKEPLLVKKQTERINEINDQITKLEEKSIQQKQEAEQKRKEVREGIRVFEETEVTEEVAPVEETQEQKDIAEMFEEEIAEVEAVAENLAINSQGEIAERSEEDNVRIDKVIDMAKRAATSVAKVLPQTKVVLHDSKAEFERFTGSTGRGLFDPQTNTIHINLTDATATTVPHEVFHAIILNKIGTDTELQGVVMNMVQSVGKVLKDTDLANYLDSFAAAYESEGEAIMNEEKMSELFGKLASGYPQLSKPQKNVIMDFIRKVASKFGIELGETFGQTDESVIDFLNTVSRKVAVGEEITDADLEIFITEQGEGGLIGTLRVPPRESKVIVTEAPSVKNDPRGFVRDLVEDTDIREFEGQRFLTNMYDYTTAGETDMGNGFMIDFVGGINYAPYMMSRRGLGIGDFSNLAAFQGKDKAESFIRNVELGGVNLFAPHSGSLAGSWQFQQHIFAELSNLVLDNNLITNEKLIDYWFKRMNNSEDGIKDLNTFYENYEKKFGEKLNSLDKFKDNPKELVYLLGIEESMSVEMRKRLNQSLATLDPLKKAIGITKLEQFYGKIIDPTNVGVTGAEIMGFVKFDPNGLQIRKTTPNDIDHHPSFSWTVDAKIEGFYQPTLFYKSYDLTDAYTKYNKDGTVVSRKVDLKTKKKFIDANVSSSAGAIPKVTEPLAVPKPSVIRKAREQKPIQQIIQESRDAGFREDVIRDLLVRRLGMKATVVDKALAKFTDLFREFGEMPKSFGDMKGGLVASKKLFKKLQAFHRREVRNNKRRVERNRISQQEIMDKTIEYMESLPEFKAEGDTYVRNGKTVTRQGYSTQQARMISDLQKMVNVRPTENVRQKIRDARKLIAEKKRQKNQLQKVKSQLRILMRKTLPQSLYTKTEALDLIQKIADVDARNIDLLIEEVIEFVVAKNNQIIKGKIENLLAKKTTKVESGRLKGTRVSVRVKEAMDFIKDSILPDDATAQQIDSKNAALLTEYNNLDKNPAKSEEDTMRMAAIKIAIEYNNSLQMEDSDSSKTESLDFVFNSLKEIDELGRTEFQLELALEQEQADSDFATAYEEIMGQPIDMTDPNVQEALNQTNIVEENKASVKKTQNKLRTILRNISQNLRTTVFTSIEALDGLIDLISKSSGEMFGGNLQKITSELIDASSRNFKQRQMYVESLIASKLQDIYGKNWQKETRKNGVENTMTFGGMTMGISQNQMYYWYNQFKDPANHGAFKSMFGNKYKEVMADLEAALDPKLKEYADWQVNELFPQLYGHYNNVYRKIYKTNMPQNENYAGRIYRKGVEPEALDLLGEKSVFNTAVGAASIKSRVNNNKKIEKFDGNIALFSYIRDMEYFAAYAEAIRRMNRMFNNEYISSAIKRIHGKLTYELIQKSITKVANQGNRDPMMSKIINGLNDAFIISRLALSPLITIKQLTSIFTYGNDIGIQNWLKYSAINLVQMRKTYKEMAENSVYMQDRGRQPITRAIEAYASASTSERTGIIPESTKNKLIDVLMYNVKAGDAAAIYLGGMPNYLYYKDQYRKKNPNATEQEVIDYAIKKFEKDTKRTQQSSDLQDKDFLQTAHPILRAMNMFMTTPRQYLRKEIQAVRNLYRKIKAWDRKAGKGTLGENIRTLMMYHFFMPMLFQYVSMGLPGLLRGWRDDDELDLLRAGFLGNLNAVFVLGEFAQWISDAYAGKPYAGEGGKMLGISSQGQRMVKLYKRADRIKDPEKREAAFKKFYLESMMLTGIPAPTIKKFIDNYSKIGTGEDIGTEIMRFLNYSEYQIKGPKDEQNKKMTTIQEINEQYEREQRKIQRESKRLQSEGGYVPPSGRKKSRRGKTTGGYVPPSQR